MSYRIYRAVCRESSQYGRFPKGSPALFGRNATACDLPQVTLPALFEAQVGRTPEATVLVFEESTLSYSELNARANRLGHLLVSQGVGPENLVAIALPTQSRWSSLY